MSSGLTLGQFRFQGQSNVARPPAQSGRREGAGLQLGRRVVKARARFLWVLTAHYLIMAGMARTQ